MLTQTPLTPQPSHICVAVDGSFFCRTTYAGLLALGHAAIPHATVRLRKGEQPEDAAWRHHRAEARYWASL